MYKQEEIRKQLKEMVTGDYYVNYTAQYDMEFYEPYFKLHEVLHDGTEIEVTDMGIANVILFYGDMNDIEVELEQVESKTTGEMLLDKILLYQGETYPMFVDVPGVDATVEIPVYYNGSFYCVTLEVRKMLEIDEHLFPFPQKGKRRYARRKARK